MQVLVSMGETAVTAVLLSGGLDSAVLLADEAERGEVQPLYIRAGLSWEAAEQTLVDAFLAAPRFTERVRPLVTLTVDMRDVYPASHWALAGRPPGYHTPDEAVYLPGRNIVLLGKAGVYCATARIGRLVLGTLGHNPFPDATPEFRQTLASALTMGLAHPLEIAAPYADASKTEVIRRGVVLNVPFALTLSCMSPVVRAVGIPLHCGICSKCRERHEAFVAAEVVDSTPYASLDFVDGRRSAS